MIAVMIAGATAMLVSLVGTRYLITFFRDRGKGQPILGKEDRGPDHHMHKQGTPTMGGLAIVVSAFFGWVVAHFRHGLVFSNQAAIAWVGILVLSCIGFLDDYIKVNKAHNRGIFWKKKSYVTLIISMGIAWWLVTATRVSETISFTRYNWPGWHVPWPVWVVFAGVTIWSTSNAVNVTDGLDGLAAGAALLAFLAFTIIAYWAFRNPEIYGVTTKLVAGKGVVNPLDLAALAAAFAGACGGFLWFNAAPARIIMGDVGALGIGTALALLALTTDTQFLLVLICGINVFEAGSVAVQMGVFKASGRKRRLFRMSPIHHHFELLYPPELSRRMEPKIVFRFLIIAILFALLSLSTLKLR